MTSRRREAAVFYGDRVAGRIRETESGMEFCYDIAWQNDERNPPVSLTMPLRAEPYATASAHPFFLGLLPEGWLHNIALSKLKISSDDWFGQLLALCHDCTGAVSIQPDE